MSELCEWCEEPISEVGPLAPSKALGLSKVCEGCRDARGEDCATLRKQEDLEDERESRKTSHE